MEGNQQQLVARASPQQQHIITKLNFDYLTGTGPVERQRVRSAEPEQCTCTGKCGCAVGRAEKATRIEKGHVNLSSDVGGALSISGLGLGLPAPFKEAPRKHVQAISIEADETFHIVPHIIGDGPLKGQQALVLVRSKPFRLMDLPVEIRYLIYAHLVTDNNEIRLRVYSPNRNTPKPRVVETSFYVPLTRSNHPSGWDPVTRKWTNKKTVTLSLLQVNKMVHREVMEVLYKTNAFCFEDARTLRLVLKGNSNISPYLSNVWIGHEYGGSNKALMDLKSIRRCLSTLKSLKTAKFSHELIEQASVSAEELVNVFAPLLKAVYKSRKETNIKTNMLDIISIDHDRCIVPGRHRYVGLQRGPDAQCLEFNKQFRRQITKRLSLKYDEDKNDGDEG